MWSTLSRFSGTAHIRATAKAALDSVGLVEGGRQLQCTRLTAANLLPIAYAADACMELAIARGYPVSALRLLWGPLLANGGRAASSAPAGRTRRFVTTTFHRLAVWWVERGYVPRCLVVNAAVPAAAGPTFACKQCAMRFATQRARDAHMDMHCMMAFGLLQSDLTRATAEESDGVDVEAEGGTKTPPPVHTQHRCCAVCGDALGVEYSDSIKTWVCPGTTAVPGSSGSALVHVSCAVHL